MVNVNGSILFLSHFINAHTYCILIGSKGGGGGRVRVCSVWKRP